ncbi:MAG: helix-turn-helix domain-containing protein [Bacteroidota bacterium]
MTNNELAKKVRELRTRKGLSQEILAENSGLSLRTIQRIENGETEPRGDSLIRLARAFNITPDEIIDWAPEENNGFLAALNISVLTFIVFPLLGLLVPLILWISKKDKIKGLNDVAKKIINFQITWNILFFVGYGVIILSALIRFNSSQEVDAGIIQSGVFGVFTNLIWIVVLYGYNIILVIVNAFRINSYKKVFAFPAIRFIR